jgi:HD-like signal output (HDOD) protein
MDPCRQLVDNIKADLKCGKLVVPSLPEVAFRIRSAVNDNNKNAFQVARVIQMDPVLASRLIQVANSAMYTGRKPVSDCQAAVSRIGIASTRNIVTSLALRQVFGARNTTVRRSLQDVWQHSCKVAAIAYVIGKVTPGIHPDRALLSGLIHDIGTLPVYRYAELQPEVLQQADRFQRMLDSIRGALGRVVLKSWGMDEELLAVPEQINNLDYQPDEKINYVDVAIVAHVHSGLSSNPDESHSVSHSVLEQYASFGKLPISQFGTDASIELVDSAQEEINDLVEMMSN